MKAKWTDLKIRNTEWTLLHHNRLENDNWTDYHRKHSLLVDRKSLFETPYKTQDQYLSAGEYKDNWLGLFKLNQTIHTSLYDPNTIRLSPKVSNEVNYRTDALLHLNKSLNPFAKSRYAVSVYTFEVNYNKGSKPYWELRNKFYPNNVMFLDDNRFLFCDAIFEIKPRQKSYDWHDIVEGRIPLD